MKLVSDIHFVDKIFDNFFKKETLTNNYILRDEYFKYIENQSLWFDVDGDNVFFYLNRRDFFRLYYFINDPGQLYHFKYKEPIVLEILYRGEKFFPNLHRAYWSSSSFEPHLTRDCYFLKNPTSISESLSNTVQIKKADSNELFIYSKELIDANLDLYTGDQLTLEQITNFAKAGFVYIAYKDGNPCGMLQADFKNNIFWLGHIVVDDKYRGKGIASELVNFYLKDGTKLNCNQFQLWVIQDNIPALKLYKRYGFNYLNKSTFSMLKK